MANRARGDIRLLLAVVALAVNVPGTPGYPAEPGPEPLAAEL
jgi:hypothetical protein